MANVKITELTAATALAGTDVLPIVDVGADATKKVSVSDLLRNLPDGTASAPALAFADDQNTGVLSPGNNSLAFATSGTQRLVIDSSGNAAIGNTSADGRLHVRKDGTGEILQIWQSDLGTNNRNIQLKSPSSDSATEPFTFSTGNSFAVQIDSSEAFRIDSSGRVLAGTTSSSADVRLALQGNSGSSTGTGVLFLQRALDHGTIGSTSLVGRIGFTDNAGNEFARVAGAKDGTSGTDDYPGSLRFYTTADGESSPTERLRIDSSGRVGIGTSSPSKHLVISSGGAAGMEIGAGNGSANGGTLIEHYNRSSGAYVQSRTIASDFVLNAGSNTFVINSSGNVGIGTTSPSRKLHIVPSGSNAYDAVQVGDGLYIGNTSNNVNAAIFHQGGGADLEIGSQQHITFTTGGVAGSATERMRIDSSGNLLIGTTSSLTQSAELRVSGSGVATAEFYNSGGCYNTWSSGSTATARGYVGSSNQIVSSGSDSDFAVRAQSNLIFATGGNTERMRIASDGKVRINRTSNLFTEQFIVESDTTSVNPMTVSNTRSSASTDYSIIFGRNGSIVGSIQTSLSATSYVTSSDHRLKQNVVDISDGITRVKQLQPRRFNFIADADTTVDGFLAHEAQTVVPEAVTGTHNQVDDDNNPVYQGIDQSKLVPVLTAALQEAIAKIETLETKVAALEAQ